MIPRPHQIKAAEEAWQIMLMFKYVLIQGMPRTGKTITALLTCEKSQRIQNVLILTPKQALKDWNATITDSELTKSYLTKNYTATNYEAVGRMVTRTHSKSGKLLKKPIEEPQLKLNPDDYDLIIVDETHRLGKLGKPTQRHKLLKHLIQGKPHIHLSGTAYVESPNSIYYQMHFPPYTPFPNLDSFYDFFRMWGINSFLKLHGRMVNQYHIPRPELLPYIEKFSVRITHDDAGIGKGAQAVDVIHKIKPSAGMIKMYNHLQTDLIYKLPTGDVIVADTTLKLRLSLQQIESGTIKVDDKHIDINFNEKINYIKKTWGDTNKVGIACYYKGEHAKIRKHLKNVEIYSSIKHAEGVNLSHLTHFVIFSFGFSGAKWIQLRERCTNINNTEANKVHILIMDGTISEQVYESVSKKHSFNNKLFKKTILKE